MHRTEDPPPKYTVTLHSDALYLGSVDVSETAGGRRARRLGGTRLKAFVFPALHWLVRHLPAELALLPARLAVTLLRPYYLWPSNRLGRACRAFARIARARRTPCDTPYRIYSRFLDNALGVIGNFFALYRRGSNALLPRIVMDEGDIETIRELIARHGGAVLAVPHNIGSAFSAMRIGHTFNMLLVAKNSPTVAGTRVALDFYERMNLSVLMVRGGNPFELSRVLFSSLREGKLVAATLDNIDRTGNGVAVNIFGREVRFDGWAAKVAVKRRVPVVPAWFHSAGRELRVITGEPILGDDTHAVVAHYVRFFERQILDDPASWAYLADKHWQRVLDEAAAEAGCPGRDAVP